MNETFASFLRWLAGPTPLDPSDPSVRLGFAHDVPAWLWATIVMGCVGVAWAGYTRIDAPTRAKIGLGALRVAALLLIALIIAGPRLIRENETTERDWLVVLVDRSASLAVADAPGGRSRDAQLREILAQTNPVLAELARDRRMLWMGFGPWAYELEAGRGTGPNTGTSADGAPVTPDLGSADARRTNLGRAMEQALARLAARPVSGVLLLTDGRSADDIPPETMRRLTGELIPVFPVALGAETAGTDLAVTRVRAPAVAYSEDVVPVTARIEARGGTPVGGVTVELVDESTGRVIETRTITATEAAEGADVTLTARPGATGERRWAVRVRSSSGAGDLVPANDERAFGIELVDRPVRVLYLDGYPRWEYRYVKNLLLRERSIDSSTMLAASNRNYIQEGDTEIRSLPRSPEEWAEFDVVVIGDLRADLLSEEQLDNLRTHVSDRGAGLLWIAGQGATPHSWRGGPLADLLPFRDLGEDAPDWDEAVTIAPTPVADRLGLLGLASDAGGWPDALSRAEAGWSALYWAQRLRPEQIKPTAEVLATFSPVAGAGDASPAVMTMQYGSGRVGYVATDETWRWRFGRGEPYTERFWVPLVRHLARERLSRSERGAEIAVNPGEPVVDQPVVVEIRLYDQALLDAGPESLTVRARGIGAGGESELTLAPSDDRGGFTGSWTAGAPGRYVFEPTTPLLAGLGIEAEVEAVLPDDELRRPQTDHVRLVSLAEKTGGEVLTAEMLTDLPARLPNRAVVIPAPPEVETLWDKMPILTLLIVLLAMEWIGRRLVRLS